MFKNIDWKGLLKAILKAALPFLLGGAIGVTATGCSSLQTPRTKTQTSAIYAFGLPAIVVTHDATQTADYSGGDTNETMQSKISRGTGVDQAFAPVSSPTYNPAKTQRELIHESKL